MIFFVIILFFFFVCFFFYCFKKYNNFNKLIFIFGKKGFGKSIYMVFLMLKYFCKGWIVYINMMDVVIFGVCIMDVQ